MCKKRSWILSGMMISLVIVLMNSGCGRRRIEGLEKEKARPENRVGMEEGRGEKDSAPLALKAWIVDGGELNPLLPSEDPSKAERKVFISNENIIFEKVVRIADIQPKSEPVERSLFLVWKDSALKSPIINAYYLYEKKDVLNRSKLDDKRHNVSQDKESGRWFISLNQAFDGELTYSDPTVTHWLTLELHLADVSVVFIRVGIRVLGLLPKLSIQNLMLDPKPSHPSEFSQAVHEKGWVLGRESITNPTIRSFTLWLKAQRETLQWSAKVLFKTYVFEGVRGEEGVITERNQVYQITFPIQVKQVQVERSGNPSEVRTLDASKPIKIVFHPFETLILEWRGLADSSTSQFSLPSPRSLNFHWRINRSARGRSEDSGALFDSGERSTSRTETWSLSSVGLLGSWSRSIVLSDPYVLEKNLDFMTFDRASSLLMHQEQKINLILGDWIEGGSPYSQQGFIY